MKRLILSIFLLLLIASHTYSATIQDTREVLGDALHPYISSGCMPTVPSPASLTLDAFACRGYLLNAGKLEGRDQSASAVGPLNSGNGTYWLAFYRDTVTAVGGWTRQAQTHYLWQQAGTQPANPEGGLVFERVTVSGGVITEAVHVAPRGGVVPSMGMVHVRNFGADGLGDDQAEIQAAIDSLTSGGVVLFGDPHDALTYTVNSSIVVRADGTYLVGLGKNTTLKAGTGSITIIRYTVSDGGIRNFTIECDQQTSTDGLLIGPEDPTQTTTLTQQNFNTFRDLQIANCTNGLVMRTGPDVAAVDSGNFYNLLQHIHVRNSVRGILLEDHQTDPSVAQVNRNNFVDVRVGCSGPGAATSCNVGFHCIGCATNTFVSTHFENIANGTSPSATPTAVIIEGQSNSGFDNGENTFFGSMFEANTRDIDLKTSDAFANKFIGINALTSKIVDNGASTTLLGTSQVTLPPVITYTSATGRADITAVNGVQITGSTHQRFFVNGIIGSSIFGVSALSTIKNPNSNFGHALAVLSDSVGRNLFLGSNDFDNATNTGTSLALQTGATHISATTSGNSLSTPVVFASSGLQPGSVTFPSLGTPADGTVVYCSDCAPNSNPCTGVSTGAIAKRLNGAWDCR